MSAGSILLHAINGVGLGHVVRLSVIERTLRALDPSTRTWFVSNSAYAPEFFRGDGFLVTETRAPAATTRVASAGRLLRRVVRAARPTAVLCDTHWPRPFIGALRARGLRTVLVLRALAPEVMRVACDRAEAEFDVVLLPHETEELRAYYGGVRAIWRRLRRPPYLAIGPIARVADSTERPPHLVPATPTVLFSVGGGGEYRHATRANAVVRLLAAFRTAAARLERDGVSSALVAGPYLDARSDDLAPLRTIRTLRAHELLREETVHVTRGGYNSCWEAVAAGSRLVLCGTHRGTEDVRARIDFLSSERLARRVRVDAAAITRAVHLALEGPGARSTWRRRVNAGLAPGLQAALEPVCR